MTSSTVRRLNLRKAAFGLLFPSAVLVTLVLFIVVEENWRGRHAWERYVGEARGRGIRLDLSEFTSPPLPDADNFAAIPLFKDVFAASEAGKQVPEPLKFPDAKGEQAPKLGDPSEGERINLEQWQDYFRRCGLLSSISQNPAADVLAALERYEPMLNQVREAAARSGAHFPVRWERGFATQIPYISTVQQLARIFALRGAALLEMGNSATAYEEVRNGLRLCHALDREPVLISGLVRLSVLERVLLPVSSGLAAHQWAEPELRAIQADLSSFRLIDDLRFSLDSERGGSNLQMDSFVRMKGREMASMMAGFAGMGESAPHLANALTPWSFYPRGWIRQNQVTINEIYDAALARCAHIERAGILSAPVDTRMDEIGRGSVVRRLYHLFAGLIMPAVQSCERQFFYVEAQVQQTLTACALERHRLAQGKYPEKLEALVPEYLQNIPRDVLAAAPMKYRLTQDGSYVLWSVGYNGKDENGTVATKKKGRDQADWVWQFRQIAERSKAQQP